jgi:hypothetical protein
LYKLEIYISPFGFKSYNIIHENGETVSSFDNKAIISSAHFSIPTFVEAQEKNVLNFLLFSYLLPKVQIEENEKKEVYDLMMFLSNNFKKYEYLNDYINWQEGINLNKSLDDGTKKRGNNKRIFQKFSSSFIIKK